MVKPGGQTHPHRWSICLVSRLHETLSRPNALPVIVQCDWLMLVSGLLQKELCRVTKKIYFRYYFNKYAAKLTKNRVFVLKRRSYHIYLAFARDKQISLCKPQEFFRE